MSQTRPRLLFIAPAMPDRGGNGLAMRQGQFLTAYAKNFDVDLAVIPLSGSPAADDSFASRLVRRLRVFVLDGVDTHFSLLLRLKAPAERLAAFKAYGGPSIAARLTLDVRRALAEWIAAQNYQLVHIGRMYLVDVGAPAPRIVDADEDDAKVFLQMACEARRKGLSVAADWMEVEAANATEEAKKHLPSSRHVFTASRDDAVALRDLGGAVTLIPNTIVRPMNISRSAHPARILFVGTLGYGPNEDAIIWFVSHCWHLLRRRLPALQFDIVGQGASPALRRLMRQPGIIWHGWQKNLGRFYARAGAVIVPVRMGGGSRIKLLEAAAYGCAIASTKTGAEGSCLIPKRDFACADDPAGFVRAVVHALRHRIVLGHAARRAVAHGHDFANWQAKIVSIVKAIAPQDMA